MKIFVSWTEDAEDNSIECPSSIDVMKNVIETDNDNFVLHEYCLRLNYTISDEAAESSPIVYIPFKPQIGFSVSDILEYLFANDKFDFRKDDTYGTAFYGCDSIIEGEDGYEDALGILRDAGTLKTLFSNAKGNL